MRSLEVGKISQILRFYFILQAQLTKLNNQQHLFQDQKYFKNLTIKLNHFKSRIQVTPEGGGRARCAPGLAV